MVIAYKDPKTRRYLDAVRLRLDGLKYKDSSKLWLERAGKGVRVAGRQDTEGVE